MAKTLVEVRAPNDPGHITDHEFAARLVNELYGVAAYAPANGATVNPDVALGGVHEIALPVGAITVGPVTTSDPAGGIQRYNPGQRVVLVLTQPAAGGTTVTWDASWRRTTSGIDTRPNAVTTIEFVNDAAAGAAPQWRRVAEAATALESVRVWHTDAASPAVTVQGAPAQSTDLTRWQTSAGTVVAKVDQVGSLTARLASFAAGAAGEVPLTVSGAAGQTADLVQYRDSAGAVKSTISATGIYNVTGIAYVGDTSTSTTTLLRAGVAANTAVVVQAAAAQTGDLTRWVDSGGVTLAKVAGNGDTQVPFLSVGGTRLAGVLASFLSNATGTVPLVSRGIAAQSANLQQWQDSTGAVLASVSSIGQVSAPVVSVANGPTTGSSIFGQVPSGQGAGVAFMLIRDSGGQDIFRVMPTGQSVSVVNSAATVASIVKAAASQSADIQQWQDSGGTARASVLNDGRIQTVSGLWAKGTFAAIGGLAWDTFGAALGVMPVASNQGGAFIRGVASQTGDLTQWQNNSGTVLAKMDSNGNLYANAGYIGPVGGIAGAQFGVSVGVTSQTPISVRAASGQTANLQEWQNSGGTAQSYISPNGSLFVTASGAILRMGGALSVGGVQATSQFQTGSAFGDGWLGLTGTVHVSDGVNYKPIKASAFTVSSAREAKSGIRPLEQPWDVIRRLRPVRYEYRGARGTPRAGFIADEVAGVFPEAVSYDSYDKPDGINYGEFVPLLVSAMHGFDDRLADVERKLTAA